MVIRIIFRSVCICFLQQLIYLLLYVRFLQVFLPHCIGNLYNFHPAAAFQSVFRIHHNCNELYSPAFPRKRFSWLTSAWLHCIHIRSFFHLDKELPFSCPCFPIHIPRFSIWICDRGNTSCLIHSDFCRAEPVFYFLKLPPLIVTVSQAASIVRFCFFQLSIFTIEKRNTCSVSFRNSSAVFLAIYSCPFLSW